MAGCAPSATGKPSPGAELSGSADLLLEGITLEPPSAFRRLCQSTRVHQGSPERAIRPCWPLAMSTLVAMFPQSLLAQR